MFPGNVSESGDIFILHSRLFHFVFRMQLVFLQFIPSPLILYIIESSPSDGLNEILVTIIYIRYSYTIIGMYYCDYIILKHIAWGAEESKAKGVTII